MADRRGDITSDPVTVASTAGAEVFARGGDNAIYQGRVTTGGTWSGWRRIAGNITSNVGAIADGDGVQLFVRGGDNGLYQGRLTTGGVWSGWR